MAHLWSGYARCVEMDDFLTMLFEQPPHANLHDVELELGAGLWGSRLFVSLSAELYHDGRVVPAGTFLLALARLTSLSMRGEPSAHDPEPPGRHNSLMISELSLTRGPVTAGRRLHKLRLTAGSFELEVCCAALDYKTLSYDALNAARDDAARRQARADGGRGEVRLATIWGIV